MPSLRASMGGSSRSSGGGGSSSSSSSNNGGRTPSRGSSFFNGRQNEGKAAAVLVGSKGAPWGSTVSRKYSVMSSKASSNYKQGGAAAHEKVSQWMQQVSALHMQEMEETFNFFDDNKDGKITAAELEAALQRLGDNPTEEQVREMMKEADRNKDGVISFEEFLALQSGVGSIHRHDAIFKQDVRQAFARFDADGDELISPEELQGALGRLGRSATLADCRRMIARVDLDGDGQINFEEFLCMMRE